MIKKVFTWCVEVYRNFFWLFDTLLVLVFSVSLVSFDIKYSFLDSPFSDEFIGLLISSYVGLLGFVLAFTAIIFSLNESEKLKRFEQSEQYPNAFNIYFRAIRWLALIILVFIVHASSNAVFSTTFVNFMVIFSVAITFIMIARCVWITRRLFRLSIN